jgi:hypothetical protein
LLGAPLIIDCRTAGVKVGGAIHVAQSPIWLQLALICKTATTSLLSLTASEPIRGEAVCNDMYPDTISLERPRGRGGDHRKTLQLCSQVADTLNYVLSGECDDELLQNLQVMSVVPAPNSSQLLVTVYPLATTDTTCDATEIRRHLVKAIGRLRSEVAASITRKKAPRLLFQVVQFTG